MSNENRYTSRFIQKHDVEANWNKAVGFYPLKGEIVVYDPDYDATSNPTGCKYPRIKVGIWDGTSTPTENMLVKNLPFTDDIFWERLKELDGDGEEY